MAFNCTLVSVLLVQLTLAGVMASATALAGSVNLSRITLPPGFEISLFAEGVEGARSLAPGPDGVLFVGTRSQGVVYAVFDRNKDGVAEEVRIIAQGLKQPNGVAYQRGTLFVAEINRVLRFDSLALAGLLAEKATHIKGPTKPGKGPLDPKVVSDSYPSDGHHGWKFIRFGPDGKLYVPVGANCNVCEPAKKIFASLTRLTLPEGGSPAQNILSEPEIFAQGIRNTVGFDWHPKTKELWFTDNGRDMLGENTPPDELNRAEAAGLHFGFPFCHGKAISDPKFGREKGCTDAKPAVQELDAHVAALGMRFYTGTQFPANYREQIFIAEHGSWNRKQPAGYRVTLVRLKDNKPASYEVFARGWLQGNNAWGRPVDVEVAIDGALLVSDDAAGVIYRIRHTGKP